MTISSLAVAGENARMDSPHPRAGGPQRRRTFSSADKLAHLAAYEQACATNDGGAYLRREGLYSSLISEWRNQRDAGALEGLADKPAGRPKKDRTKADLANARAELDRLRDELATAREVIKAQGKVSALLHDMSHKSAEPNTTKP